MPRMDLEPFKKQAAEMAVAHVKTGMVVGLGTGSTSVHAVRAVAARMKSEGLKVIGVPTSSRTAELARSLGIPLATLEEQPRLDLAIDGADEIDPNLDLIKGAGGALLQERLVEVSAARFIVIADHTKKVARLGTNFAVPVEVVRFGHKSTASRLEALGCKPVLRAKDGQPFITDEQHYIYDCKFAPIADARKLASQLKAITGVVEHGLFIGMAAEAFVAGPGNVEVLKPGKAS